jgi:hypothetical protein
MDDSRKKMQIRITVLRTFILNLLLPLQCHVELMVVWGVKMRMYAEALFFHGVGYRSGGENDKQYS